MLREKLHFGRVLLIDIRGHDCRWWIVMFEAYNKSLPLSRLCVCLCIAETEHKRERTSESLK